MFGWMGKGDGLINNVDAPWRDGRPAFHSLIAAAMKNGAPRNEELKLALPEPTGDEVRWAPGALDSLLGALDKSARQIAPRTVAAALSKAVRRPSPESFRHLYAILESKSVIDIVDTTLELLTRDGSVDRIAMATLSRRIIYEAPDPEPVKAAIALLGVFGEAADADLVLHMGRHEEFSLFSAVALRNLLENPDEALWTLARQTYGWGRINAVYRLTGTEDVRIKAWMLREGYRNAIMYEYLAYTCAVTGDLKRALEAETVDEALLNGAGEIILALINGGPAEDMSDYNDGAESVRRFVNHLTLRPPASPIQFRAALQVLKYVDEPDRDWASLTAKGWNKESRFEIRTRASSFTNRPEWDDLATNGLKSQSDGDFWPWAEVAEAIGIDVWPWRFRRQQARQGDQWFFLMQTDDQERIKQVVDLATAHSISSSRICAVFRVWVGR